MPFCVVISVSETIHCGKPFKTKFLVSGGAKGAENLSKSSTVGKILSAQESSNGVIAAVCAAPTALAAHGIAKGRKVTSYPAPVFKEKMTNGYTYLEVITHST